ncbi:copper amine oxidase N-terminal domain-containing protein [Paenibacillus sp. P96]|uniref:Copper amine oxidase N-terminal domain-containing protein n=1 Tax=Paenibacillus zeirhizosphaerae TaxID=2987519 RepID=A0ABT9FLC2_9BACL|nr:stalk domain-containing protein [Paenibacillus sp. P96]MDP4095484.1 copper amine oxidase N-terminal domain-containing protein [Paenibacillus sp. P96]
MVIGLVTGMLIGSATVTAAATTPTVQATLSKFSFSVDGESKNLKSDPLVYKGTTYLPVREVAEITGYDLTFDSKAKSIELESKSEGDVTVSDNTSPAASTDSLTWITARDAKKQYDISIVMSDTTTVSHDGKEISFPLSMRDTSDKGGKIYKSTDNSSSLKIQDGAIYLGSDTLQALGIAN